MKSKLIISAVFVFTAQALKADPVANLELGTSSPLVIAALVIGVLALLISIANAFRISRVNKLSEVNFINQKEDINLSMESIKTVVTRDLNRVKKELKKNKPQQPSKSNKTADKKVDNKNTEGKAEDDGVKKTPARRKYRRKLPYKKNLEKAAAEAAEPGSSIESNE